MHKDKKSLVTVLIIGLVLILFCTLSVLLSKPDFALTTHIVEVGEENTGSYCLIKYFDMENLTSESNKINRQKCKEEAEKLFGADKAEHVQIRYKYF